MAASKLEYDVAPPPTKSAGGGATLAGLSGSGVVAAVNDSIAAERLRRSRSLDLPDFEERGLAVAGGDPNASCIEQYMILWWTSL